MITTLLAAFCLASSLTSQGRDAIETMSLVSSTQTESNCRVSECFLPNSATIEEFLSREFSCGLTRVFETAPNTRFMKKIISKVKQKFRGIGEGFARKGKRIFFRVLKDGRRSWKSAETDKMHLARRYREKYERDEYNRKLGASTSGPSNGATNGVSLDVDTVLDTYIEAHHPIITKAGLKEKAPRTIQNEEHCLGQIREFFGTMQVLAINLGTCDRYRGWRLSGGYVSTFKVRGNTVTRRTRGGNRAVDLELTVLSNAISLSVRREDLPKNPIAGRGRYTDKSKIIHCREKAPTPRELNAIAKWLRKQGYCLYSDFAFFLAYSGLRIGEGLCVRRGAIDWKEELIDVKREKKGVLPWVIILPEMMTVLKRLTKRKGTQNDLLFPGVLDRTKPLDASSFRRALKKACKKLKIRHVTPHGLRSYFVTQARLSGLTDAEIAVLIGDSSGPGLIAQVYGDVRPDHLLKQARRIRLTATSR